MAKIIDTFRDLPHKLHLGGGGKAKANDKQLRQFKEFFDIKPACKFGFPECATAVAYDQVLDILAVGSRAGEILVFGAPGVEFFASHVEASEVSQLAFLPNEGRLVSLTSNNKLHKWQLNAPEGDQQQQQWRLDLIASLDVGSSDGQRVTSIVAVATNNAIWLGYENGQIREVDVASWKFGKLETSSEIISACLSDEAKSAASSWGPVVAMETAPTRSTPTTEAGDAETTPTDDNKKQQQQQQLVAVAYRGGPVVLLRASDAAPKCLALTAPAGAGGTELECVAWRSGTESPTLLTGHADGAYVEWQIPELPEQVEEESANKTDEKVEEDKTDKDGETKTEKAAQPAPVLAKQLGDRTIVYGPFPCQPIGKLAAGSTAIAFAGGLAKNTHAEVHSVTLTVGQRQACYELPDAPVAVLLPKPDCLLAVCQTRLLAIDIGDSSSWLPIRSPYLRSLSVAGASVTVARVFGPLADLPEPTRVALEAADAAAAASSAAGFSQRDWPIAGGRVRLGENADADGNNAERHLLVTGHADSGVAFWMLDSRRGLGAPFGRLDTGRLFLADGDAAIGEAANQDGDAFPKLLRNVGLDFPPPPSTDSRLGVVDVQLVGEGLLVTGSGGQATVWSPTSESEPAEVQLDLRTVRADFLAEGSPAGSAYEWTGPGALQIRPPEASAKFAAPFRPSCLALVSPPTAVSSAAYSQRWGLLAVGSAYGVAVFDTRSVRLIAAHPTLPAAPGDTDSTGASATNGSAADSGGLGSSLRQSFRMLKKFRPGRKQEYTVNSEKKQQAEPADKKPAEEKKPDEAEEKKPEDTEEKKPEETEEKKPEEAEEKKPEEETAKKPADSEPAAAEGAAAEGAAAASEPAEQPEAEQQQLPEKQKLSPTDARPRGQIGALLIAETHLTSAAARAVSLLAGDAAGRILAFQLTRPPAQPAKDEAAAPAAEAANEATADKPAPPEEGNWQAQLVKELHLKHGAPVAALYALSARDHSIVDAESTVDGPHELLVASEEQVKLFTLPGLKPRVKCRLTGRLQAGGHSIFPSSTRPDVKEFGLAAYLDNGTLLVLGFPGLRVHAWREHFLEKGRVAICCRGGAPVAVTLEAGGRLVTVHRLAAGSLGAAFQRVAGLDLPEGARKKPEQEQQQAAAAAAATASAAAAAAAAPAAESAPPINGTAENDEEPAKDSANKEAAEQKDGAGDEGSKPVAADITMDDIKEYATGTGPSAVSTEPIPEVAGEDKRESTISSGGAEKETPAAEIKGGDADKSAEPAAAENCKAAE